MVCLINIVGNLSALIPGCDPAPGRQVEEPEYQVPSPAITDSSSRDRLYEVPDDIHDGGKKEKSQSFDNPGYHSTLQDVHSTTDQHTFPAATAIVRESVSTSECM